MEQLQVIQSKIYEIRGQKVMLDRDLAEMYGVWRKRSIPTHLERHNPPTIIAKMGLKRA